MADEFIHIGGDSSESVQAFAKMRHELLQVGEAISKFIKQSYQTAEQTKTITTTVENASGQILRYKKIIDESTDALIKEYTILEKVEESYKNQVTALNRLIAADERRAISRQKAIEQAHKQAEASERAAKAAQEEAMWQEHASRAAAEKVIARNITKSTQEEIRYFKQQIAEENKLQLQRERALQRLISTIQRKAYIEQDTDKKSADNLRRALQGIKDLDEATTKFGLTWEGAFRLVLVQLIHQAVTNLLRSMREGVQTAIDFHIKIAEVMTIDPNKLPFNYWAEGIRKLSDIYGTGILDQTEAAYQTLSNQVAKSGETFEFLATANELAIATVSDTQVAVNALTSVINAYNLSLTDAKQIAADYFMSVDLGRFRLIDLADTIGTVAASAAQIGIPMRDLHAALDLMTIRGVTSANAMTYMRNIIMRLLKPTGEMAKYFQQLGVSTGEQAIRTYTLAGFMQRMMEVTQGASDEIADMFNNIRSVTGALLFAGQGIEDYNRILAQFDRSMENYNRAITTILSDLGKRFRIEFEQIKNYFISDIGTKILETIDLLSGGIEHFDERIKLLSKTFKYLFLPVLVGVTKQIYNLLFVLTKSPIGQIVIALSAVAVIGEVIEHISTTAIRTEERLFETLKENSEKILKIRTKVYNLLTEAFTKSLTERQQIFDKYISNETIKLNEEIQKQSKLYQSLETVVEDVYKSITRIVKTAVKSQQDLVNTFDQDIKRLTNLAKSIQEDLESYVLDTLLKATEKFPQAQINILQQQRAILEARQRTTTDTDTIEKLSRKIIDLAQKENDIQNNLTKQNIIRQNTLTVVEQQLELVRQLTKEKEKQLATEKQTLEHGEQLEQVLSDTWGKIKDFKLDSVLKIEDPVEFQAAIEAQENLLKQFIRLAADIRLPISAQIPFMQEYNSLVKIKEDQLRKLDLQQKAKEYQATVAEYESIVKRSSDIENLLQSLDKAKTDLYNLMSIITKTPVDYYLKAMTMKEVIEEAKVEIKKMQDAIKGPDISDFDIYKKMLYIRATGSASVNATTADIYQKRIKELETLFLTIDTLTENLAKLGGIEQLYALRDRDAALKAILTQFEQVIDPQIQNTQAFQLAINNFNTAINKLIAYLDSRQTFAVGGLAKGTDIVPAMLTPGEFVVNKAATQRFYSQLVAMNQGMQPRYMANGGEVTNVGGINVTVNAANTPEKTARTVISEINRALHRRVIHLRK